MLRVCLTATLMTATLMAAVFGSAGEVRADESGYHPKKQSYAYRKARRSYSNGGFYGYIGGHRYGEENTPYIYANGPYSNPGFFDNRTFWERVETQAQYPIR